MALVELALGNIQAGSGEFVEGLLAEEQTVRGAAARTPEEVLAEVSRTHGVTPEQNVGPSRERPIARARAAFYVRAQEEAAQTLADLARMTGRSQPAV
jgi:hypothetical protein